MSPTKDEFAMWRESPITRWIMSACRAMADSQKNEWWEVSWKQGQAEPLLLTELRTRADAYAALFETEYEGWCIANGDDPRAE